MIHFDSKFMRLMVNQDYSTMMVEVYFEVQRGDKLFVIGFDGSQVVEQEVTLENESAPLKTFKPLFRMSIFMFEAFVGAFLKYADEKEYPKVDENIIQGKLIATEKHLEDMREMFKQAFTHIIR